VDKILKSGITFVEFYFGQVAIIRADFEKN
jgi:hypothetical protein